MARKVRETCSRPFWRVGESRSKRWRSFKTVEAKAAASAGEIRADISAEDVLRALIGMCYLHDQPGWQNSVLRLLDVFVDGLRIRGAEAGKTRPEPRKEKARGPKPR